MADEREERRERVTNFATNLDMAVDWIVTLQGDIAELKRDIATLIDVRDDLVGACETAERSYLIGDCHGDCDRCIGCQLRAALAKAKSKGA